MANKLIVIDDSDIFEKEVEISHEEALREYLKISNLDLDIKDLKNLTSFELSNYLASLNIISIHIENSRALYYLGNKLTNLQYNYLKKNKRKLRKYKTAFVNLEDNNQIFYDEYTRLDENIFKLMYEALDNKEIIETPTKTKIKEQEY